MDWKVIEADQRFRHLHRLKVRFLGGLMLLAISYYFLLPLGAAYYPELFKMQLWGRVNIGVLFALSQFLIAWAVAILYAWRARTKFDVLTEEIVSHYTKGTQHE